ncbi:hypothetical protein SUNI508_11179 [Seiridium unicorne]|uniref:Uncharacterized protein n=1 Tax=Seiridium unicorne TaxID=138068 RepID=A0ABR2UIK8_9PEZI
MLGHEMLGLNSLASFAAAVPLNITPLSSRDGYSIIQCWQLASIPVEAMSAWNYGIGNTSRATWSIIEPRTVVADRHSRLTMVLNGLIHVSALAAATSSNSNYESAAPISPDGVYFQPGTLSSSILIATDLKNVSYVAGHWTEFPGNKPTVLVQTPFFDNKALDHTVLHDGPCA